MSSWRKETREREVFPPLLAASWLTRAFFRGLVRSPKQSRDIPLQLDPSTFRSVEDSKRTEVTNKSVTDSKLKVAKIHHPRAGFVECWRWVSVLGSNKKFSSYCPYT